MQRQQTGGRLKAVLILSLSLIAAGVAVVLVLKVVAMYEKRIEQARERPDLVDVAIATRELYTGVAIGPDDIVIRSFDPAMVPPEGTFSDAEELMGRTPRERILPNEIIRADRLAVADAGIGLNAIISPGKRAMSVAVDTESGVAGFLQPGNFVDVIVTIRPDDGSVRSKWVSHAFLQGVKVLAVGRNMGAERQTAPQKKASRREKPTVTLELTLEQAQELALSASKGDIHIVLRNDIDITRESTHGAVTQNLVGLQSEGASSAPARPGVVPTPRKDISEVIQGDRVEEVEFSEDGSKTISVPSKKRRRR